ncbi:MAG TPA: DsbE family thiol:disulfide interchange protein [Gammaproteobacteria bacterium]|nr:DsbE family thiol:disulfide interchange protein [Gammaproteobacteria bacterium]
MKARYLIPLILFIVMAAFLGIGLKLDPRDVPSPLIGKVAPDFDLPSLHNPEKRVRPGDFKGKIWLFNVWATWCVSCRHEHPTLVEFSKASRIPIVGLDWKDEADTAREWLSTLGNPYIEVAFDVTGRTAIDWGVYGAPETYLIDKEGIIRLKHTGPINLQVLRDKIIPKIKELQEAS